MIMKFRATSFRTVVFTLLPLILCKVDLLAQSTSPDSSQSNAPVLRVLARNIEPFCFEKNGQRVGFAVDLWKEISRIAGFKYELHDADSAQALVEALAAKKGDVGLGALSITAEREQVIDFSYPFYNSGFDIVTSTESSSILGMIRVLFHARLLKTIGLLLALVIFFSHILWLFERRVNADEFPDNYKAGLFESLWWTLTVLITLGCENKSPRGVPGRLMAIVWMASGVLMISLLTASFSSSLTVRTLEGTINGPADLSGHEVATVSGSTAERWLKGRQIKVKAFPTVAEAMAAVAAEQAAAVVYDEPILRYHIANNPNKKLRLVGNIFEEQGYGFGLQLKSPYHKKINQVLLELVENKTVEILNKKWFGEISNERNGNP
jgi:polar amino acid transport system substrate-binding protein